MFCAGSPSLRQPIPLAARGRKVQTFRRHPAPLCAAEPNRGDAPKVDSGDAVAAALVKLAKGAGKILAAAEEALAKDELLKKIAAGAAEVLEDLNNPRTGLIAGIDNRPAVERAREMILQDRAERKKTEDQFKQAGIPVETLDPAALPLLPEMTASERQAAVASSSAPAGPIVVPTNRLPKARVSDLTRAKWNVAVEEAYRTQLQKQQTEIQGEIKKAEGQGKPPDMSEDEWNSVVKRLKAVEQAIKEQNDQVRQLTMLLQMAEQSGQLNAEVTDAAVASLQRGAQAVGQGIAQAAAGAAPAAGAPGGAQRVSTGISVDSDVDKILSSALSELGLEGDSGPDRVVRVTGAELEDRIRQWAFRESDVQLPQGGGEGSDGEPDGRATNNATSS